MIIYGPYYMDQNFDELSIRYLFHSTCSRYSHTSRTWIRLRLVNLSFCIFGSYPGLKLMLLSGDMEILNRTCIQNSNHPSLNYVYGVKNPLKIVFLLHITFMWRIIIKTKHGYFNKKHRSIACAFEQIEWHHSEYDLR